MIDNGKISFQLELVSGGAHATQSATTKFLFNNYDLLSSMLADKSLSNYCGGVFRDNKNNSTIAW